MTSRRIVVTGRGIIGACGTGAAAVWDSVRHGADGLRPLSLFSSTRYAGMPVGEVTENVDRLAGKVRGSRSDKLAWIAAREAVESAGLTGVSAGRIGVVLGATVGGMLGSEKFVRDSLRHEHARYGVLRFHECAASADLIAQQLGVTGPVLTFSTACSGSALAISAAGELIANGETDVVLAGGCDSLCRLTLNGFGSLLLLDPQGCRPFDAGRAGISLGEGAAVLVLEAEETARARGATVLAELTGWGASCDAYHATAPQPDGAGAFAAMVQALARAGVSPSEIGYVSAHGTGTRDNDLMEGRALRQLLGDTVPPVSSMKRLFGHTLGASGAINAAVCVLALEHQALPPSPGFGEPDPEIGIAPVRECRASALRHVLSNSFGFGGNNVALVFSTPETSVVGPASRLPSVDRRQPERLPCNGKLAIVGVGVVGPACGEFGAEKELSAARRRRLSRLQQMTLVAAKRCLPAQFDAGRTCVAIGTGLGSLNEATAFVENMILKDEVEPQPQQFTNSVHNALAAQVAIEFGLKGLNSTPTCHEISFEAALWHAAQELRAGTATLALAGAADELNRYAVAAHERWQLPGRTGEGAVVVALAATPTMEKPLGYLKSVWLGRYTGNIEAEAQWMAEALAGAELDVLVTDERGAVVAETLGRLTGRTIPVELYKQSCGEHYAASAFGFAAALRLLGKNERAAVYTVGVNGVKGLCVVER
ncbi:MAG: beta-ketoacyl-[acyl-carrier-protein] synthase family protein [Verrucomicrobiia bacterium]|jgi:3-oxoacyl-[acyl-carrier-protein] synthase-1/3-oxoacyl-[acyl-carrier-protein] synthase II